MNPVPTIGCFDGIGPLGDFACQPDVQVKAFTQFTSVMSIIISITTISAGLWFIMHIFINAFKWLVSDGEKQAVETARKGITNAVIGLFLVVFAYGFTALVGSILGIPNILAPIQLLLDTAPPITP